MSIDLVAKKLTTNSYSDNVYNIILMYLIDPLVKIVHKYFNNDIKLIVVNYRFAERNIYINYFDTVKFLEDKIGKIMGTVLKPGTIIFGVKYLKPCELIIESGLYDSSRVYIFI